MFDLRGGSTKIKRDAKKVRWENRRKSGGENSKNKIDIKRVREEISEGWNSTKIGERCKSEKARGGSTKKRDTKKVRWERQARGGSTKKRDTKK